MRFLTNAASRLLFALTATGLTAGCGGGDPVAPIPVPIPGAPASFTKLVGDSTYTLMAIQTSGYFVEQSVLVRDAKGTPVPQAKVTFTVVPGSGTLGPSGTVIVTSDAGGIATVPAGTWNARFVANTESTLLFAAEGQPTAGWFTLVRVGNSFGYANCELSNSGLAFCTGFNGNGAVGDGTNTDRNTFVPVSGGRTYASLGDGVANHHCALTAAGQAYCWGQNSMGELGDGTVTDRNVPTLVGGGLSFTRIYTQLSTTCALTAANATYCWGFSGTAGWGGGDTQRAKRYLTPTLVATGGLTFRKLALQDDGLCGITATGTVACLSRGYLGGNGDGSTVQRTTFSTWAGTWKDLAAANLNICALNTTGVAYCVGSDQGGALGSGVIGAGSYTLTPFAVAGFMNFESIWAGNLRACGITTAHDVYCWGFQPGDGSAQTGAPVKVQGLTTAALRIGSFRNACGKAASGQLYCWGSNAGGGVGTVGDGTTVDRLAPVPVKGWPDGGP